MIFPSDLITINTKEYFVMTKEEVKYFLDNISHEYLSKDTYNESMDLIKRMREFLGEE